MTNEPVIILDVSEESLSKTHNKSVKIEPGFPFHDLNGKPMLIEKIHVTTWTPKIKNNDDMHS